MGNSSNWWLDDGKLAAISHFYCFRSRPRNNKNTKKKTYIYIIILKKKKNGKKKKRRKIGEKSVREIGQPNNLWKVIFLNIY